MKITKSQLKQIIKEEVSKKLSEASMEDLEARLGGIDTRRTADAKKLQHREARDDLIEIARTLKLMADLHNAIVRKGSKNWSTHTINGVSVQDIGNLIELSDIVREYAKHVKDAETQPVNERHGSLHEYENLKLINDRIEGEIDTINSLGEEEIHGSTQGGPWDALPVDRYIEGYHLQDVPGTFSRKYITDQGENLAMLIRFLRRPVPPALTTRLKKEVDSGFLKSVHGLKSTAPPPPRVIKPTRGRWFDQG